jgi:hypothetical protein
LTTEYFVQESFVACGVGSEHRRRISWIAERPYEIALFEVERRNMAPNGAGQFDNPPPAASRTIPFSKSQPRSDAPRSGERERISRLLGSGRLEPFQKLALLLLDHLDGILNCCRTKVPLGVVEAVNGPNAKVNAAWVKRLQSSELLR